MNDILIYTSFFLLFFKQQTIINDISYIEDIIMYTFLCSSNRQTVIRYIYIYIKDILTYTSIFQARDKQTMINDI